MVVLEINGGQWAFNIGRMSDPRQFNPYDPKQNNEDVVALMILSDLVYQLVQLNKDKLTADKTNVPRFSFFTQAVNAQAALDWAFGSKEVAYQTYDEFKELLRALRISFYRKSIAKRFEATDGYQIHKDGTVSIQLKVTHTPTGVSVSTVA